MYWVPDYDHNWNDKALKDLEWIEENFQHTSKELLLIINSEGKNSNDTYYNNLCKNLDEAISKFIEDVDFHLYPSFYSLYEGSYIDFDNEDNKDKYMIATYSDYEDEDEITIFKNPKEYYPLFLKELKEYKNLKDISFSFDRKAYGYDDTDHYKNLTKSFKGANKYNLFENLNDESNAELFIFTSNEYNNGKIRLVALKEDNIEKATKIIYGSNYNKNGYTSSSILRRYTDLKESFVTVERERTFVKDLNFSIFNTLEQALKETIERHEDFTTDEMYIFKLYDGVHIKFENGRIVYNDTIPDSIILSLEYHKFKVPSYSRTDKLDIEKEIFSYMLKNYPNSIKDGKWRDSTLENITDEERNLYKSLTSGNKFKLFDYNSFNENTNSETFKFIQFHTFSESYKDYIQLTNDSNYSLNDDYPDMDGYLESYTQRLEQPLSYGDEFYLFCYYADDNAYFKVSLDPLKLAKEFIDVFDIFVENTIDDNFGGLDPSELYGRIAITTVPSVTSTRKTQNFIEASFGKDSILHTAYSQDTITSYFDDVVFKAIDKDIKIETIKRIKWQDPNFAEKHGLLKTVKTLNKYNL